MTFTLSNPSTKTFIVPSGSFKSCRTLPSHPKEYRSFSVGSSISAFYWVIKSIFLFVFITSFNALIDLSRPTNKGTIIPGKTTMSLNGNDGKKSFLLMP